MILNILGGGGSGKTTLKFALLRTGKFRGVVPFTTRPRRIKEIEGTDYHFVTPEEFLQMKFLISRTANGWHYGVREKDLLESGDRRIIVTTFDINGIDLLIEMKTNIKVVYLDVSSDVREKRMCERGDTESEIQCRLAFDSANLANVRFIANSLRLNNETTEEAVKKIMILAELIQP